MAPDVANLAQQPGQKACRGPGGCGHSALAGERRNGSGGGRGVARVESSTAGSREARAGVETNEGDGQRASRRAREREKKERGEEGCRGEAALRT